MILIDYSGVAYAAITVMREPLSEQLIRHMILNSIRMYNNKYSGDYGEVIICTDNHSWRKDEYAQYKFKRHDTTNASPEDIERGREIIRVMNIVKEELNTFFPYRVVNVYGAEADDIIATLVKSTLDFGKTEPVLIVSADHDFYQLHKHKHVKQWHCTLKKFVREADPDRYRFEQIVRGCKGDGVPNILSPDNAFSDGIRQTPIRAPKIDEWYNNRNDLKSVMPEEAYRNFQRNTRMIDLIDVDPPGDLMQRILEARDKAHVAPNSGILNYLIKNKCRQLISCVSEFFPKC